MKLRPSFPIPFNKEVIPMLNSLCLFQDLDPILSIGSGYPVKDLQDNGDGTYRGHLDLDRMSSSKKFRALGQLKSEYLNHKILQPSMV